MDQLVYPRERSLFGIAFVIALVLWLALIIGTLGIGLVYLLFAYIAYLFAQSALISHIKGTAVRLGPHQLSDLHTRVHDCCQRLGVRDEPEAYLLHGPGVFNAFATRFLGRNFIVLFSDVVDAMHDRPEAINFYIGHELGHIDRKHLRWRAFLTPALFLPLLGNAYSRAREYTCDRYGLACCATPEDALRGLLALAAGHERWRGVNLQDYGRQADVSGHFWMAFHEVLSGYPWLVKRAAWLSALENDEVPHLPARNPFIWLLAIFLPCTPGGSGAGSLMLIAMIGVMAAVAIPAYQDYAQRAIVATGLTAAQPYQQAVFHYVEKRGVWPGSNTDIGLSAQPEAPEKDVSAVDVGDHGAIRVEFSGRLLVGKALILTPSIENHRLKWHCNGDGMPKKWEPPACR